MSAPIPPGCAHTFAACAKSATSAKASVHGC
jgi:hypothetical protein